MTELWDAAAALADTLGGVAGKVILDIGSGEGGLAKTLAEQGAAVTGLDPLGPAQDWTPAGPGRFRLMRRSAEALPFEDASVDAVLFIFSLHHIPAAILPGMLKETARVLRPSGHLFVAEPLAAGPMQEITGLFHDETAVRAEAARILAAHAGLFGSARQRGYVSRRRYAGFDEYATRMLASLRFNDFTEAALRAPEVRARFDAVSAREGGVLDQPVRVDVFAR